MSRDIKNCPKCGAPVHHFYTYLGDIDYAQCERNSNVVFEDGRWVHKVMGKPSKFFCWSLDY